MVEFKSKDACKKFLYNQALDHLISDKRAWDRNFVSLNHIVWLYVEVIHYVLGVKVLFI